MAVLPEPPWPASEANSQLMDNNLRRQNTPEGNVDCSDVSNGVISCFPTSSTKLYQNQSMHFVWNPNQPSFAQFNRVDVFLKHQDTLQLAVQQTDIPNQPGRAFFPINDSWWGTRGNSFNGTDIEYPMFFIIVAHNGNTLTATPQSTFTAIQTRVPDSILAQEASQSAAAASSSSSAATLTSGVSTATAGASGSSGRGTSSPSNTSGANGLQQSSGSGGFPVWGIALLVIFGVLALVFVLLATWLGLRRYKRRSGRRDGRNGGSMRESMGSHTPMMAEVAPTGQGDEPGSPGAVSSSQGHQSFVPPSALGAAGLIGAGGSSRAGSTHTKDTDAPFSGADAAIMAAAFRDRLRKPDFANRPLEEGESPDKDVDSEEERELFLQRQLREEGRDLRSVASSKGVRIQREGEGTFLVHDNRSMSTLNQHGVVSRDFDPPNVDIG